MRALSERRGMPAGVHLQVADRCNHACHHCYQIQGQKGELSLPDVLKVVDDLANQGVLTLNVSGGEATLRPDLLDILAHARAKGFAVRLYTNAFLVDEAYADKLAHIGLYEVHVSVYSGVPEEHDAVTRVPGSFVRTVAGVTAMRARGMRVQLKCPATSLSAKGHLSAAKIAESLGCSFKATASITPAEDGSMGPLEVAVVPEQLVASGLLQPWQPELSPKEEREAVLSRGPCSVGKGGVVVLPNGDLLPCTDTPLRVGNVVEDGFAATMQSESMEVFRSLTRAHVHGCRDCDLIPACQRCHATALHEAGDYLGPYRSGCETAKARYAAAVGPLRILSPLEGCEPGRDSGIGPYQIESEGVLRPIPDIRTEQDYALVLKNPWIRPGSIQPSENQLLPVSGLLRNRGEAATGWLPR
jgi:AdoMet-dependent heme synthase